MTTPQEGPSPFDEQLRGLGITPEAIAAYLEPLVSKITVDALNDLVPKMVVAQMDQMAGKVAAQIRESLNSPSVDGAPAPGAVQNPTARNPMIDQAMSAFATALAQKFAGGGGAPGGAGQFAGVNQAADAIGHIFTQVMGPISNIYSQGRADAHREITTLARTGFEFPWSTGEQPTDRGPDMGAAARDVAARIHVDAPPEAAA